MLELFELQKFSPNYQEINQNIVCIQTPLSMICAIPILVFFKKKGKKCTITSYKENGYRRAIICGSAGDVGGLQALASLFLGVIG